MCGHFSRVVLPLDGVQERFGGKTRGRCVLLALWLDCFCSYTSHHALAERSHTTVLSPQVTWTFSDPCTPCM